MTDELHAGPARIQTPDALPEDELDRSLRPRRLEDFVGQDAVQGAARGLARGRQARGEALDHVLLAGPPGLGKTSLAQIVAASSASRSCRPPARRSSARATSPPS